MNLKIKKVTSFLVEEDNLPKGYKVSYKGKADNTDDELFFLIIADKEIGYPSSRVFIGKGESLSEVEVTSTTRYRDGGTTIIETMSGVFNFPSPLRPKEKPTLNGKEVTML